MIVVLRLYACALTFAAWSGCWWAGLRGSVVTGAFLTLAAFTLAIGERERSRQRRLRREHISDR